MNLLFKEAFVVGIILLLVSIPIMKIQQCICPKPSTTAYYISTILIGIIVHLFCEYAGINQYYCKNSYACNKIKNKQKAEYNTDIHPASIQI